MDKNTETNKNGNLSGIGYKNPPKETQFSSTNQPENVGRPKGSIGYKKRQELFDKWAVMESDVINPFTGIKERLTQDDIMVLNLIKEARNGRNNVAAIKEYLDNRFGKQIDKLDANLTTSQINLTIEQKEAIVKKYLESNG